MSQPTVLSCPHCQGKISHDDNLAGQTGSCSNCHRQVQMPEANKTGSDDQQKTHVPCPKCGKELRAPRHGVGGDIKCPKCGHHITVPAKAESTNKRCEDSENR